MTFANCPKCGSSDVTTAGVCANCGWVRFPQVMGAGESKEVIYNLVGEIEIKVTGKALLEDYKRLLFENNSLTARIAELEGLVDELKPYRDGYDPEEDFPPEGEWVWLRDCDDDIEPVQYDPKSGWYWNYEGNWMPDNGDIRRWYPIGTLPEVQE